MTSLICFSSRTSLNGGISESPFSIQCSSVSSVTLLLFTVKVPRLLIPFKPGPIFFAVLLSKWQTEHFCWKISLPRAIAAGSLPGPIFDFVCARTAPASVRATIPKSARVRFTRVLLKVFPAFFHFPCLLGQMPLFQKKRKGAPVRRDRFPTGTTGTSVPFSNCARNDIHGRMNQETLTRAWEILQDAYQAQMEGDYERAEELYQSSLELHPTAEAHTFLGWTYHFQGRLQEAIAECKRAIEIDPDFGNPYNDIGAYLIELEQYDEAIPWLNQAVEARRYEPRHFPHYNLGRAYLGKEMYSEAMRCFEEALKIEPRYSLARHALASLRRMVN